MIVVDANIVVAFVIENAFAPDARAVHAMDPDWVAPALWQSEVLNALLNELKAGKLALEGALEAVKTATQLLRERTRDCRPSAILSTAHDTGLTAYDATYVALARSLGLSLITEDKQILRACPDVARSMRHFLTPPDTPATAREKPAAYKTRRAGKRTRAGRT